MEIVVAALNVCEEFSGMNRTMLSSVLDKQDSC